MSFERNKDNAMYGPATKHLPSGLYVVKILRCMDNENPLRNKPKRFEFEYDIVEGSFKNFFADEYDNFASRSKWPFWTGTFLQNYEGKSAGYMDALINRFELSNNSFRYRNDGGRCFEGFLIVVSIQAEEYERNGYTNWRYNVKSTYSISEYENEKDLNGQPLKVYKDKPLKAEANNSEELEYSFESDDLNF